MMKQLITGLFIAMASSLSAQTQVSIGFYNVENLFDTLDDPQINDNEFLPESRKLWGFEHYNKKLNNLAKVIGTMNNGQPIDILGLSEVENKQVIVDLVNTAQLKGNHYEVVHVNSPDERGIDVALIFKSETIKLIQYKPFNVEMPDGKDRTRDILWVQLLLEGKDTLDVLVNHWPSRAGGQVESDPKRMAAGIRLKGICDSLQTAHPNRKIIAMGDLNDEPKDASIQLGLGACYDDVNCTGNQMFNLMMPLKEEGKGSIRYKGQYELIDQLLISKGLQTTKKGFKVKQNSASVFNPSWLMETEGKFAGNPYRTFVGDKFLGGYSDHFPVFLVLEKNK